MVFGMGITELVIILVIALVIFGPKNLPKLGEAMGKTVKSVREGMEDDDKPAAPAPAAPTPAEAPQAVAAPEPVVEEVVEADVVETVETVAEEAAEVVDAETEAKFCPACGAENPATNVFCAKCGEKLQ